MAWTITKYQSVFGNKRVVQMKITADATTFNVRPGLSYIESFSGPHEISMTSNVYSFTISPNSTCCGSASNGVLGCTGFTNGDDFFMTVYGR